MTHGKCDYSGCSRFGEQLVSFELDRWDDAEYCERHALEETDTGWYAIERPKPVVSTEG